MARQKRKEVPPLGQLRQWWMWLLLLLLLYKLSLRRRPWLWGLCGH